MKLQRILAVVAARNREFYRDKAGLGWNLLMPAVMVLGFAFIFSGGRRAAVQGRPPRRPPLREPPTPCSTPGTSRSSRRSDGEAALTKLRQHQIDLLLDLRDDPRYWVNEESARGHLAERLLWQGDSGPPRDWCARAVSGRAVRYVDWVLPGVLAMNVMFSSLWGVGWVIVRYRKNGVLRRLRATPLSAGEFLVAQILSRLLVVSVVTVLVFVATDLLLDFPMRGSYLALTLVFLSGAIALISMGLTVSARVRSEELADGLLNLISWPMMILSGIWFSLEGTNVWAQRLAEFLPLTHMVDAARRVMLDGAGVTEVAVRDRPAAGYRAGAAGGLGAGLPLAVRRTPGLGPAPGLTAPVRRAPCRPCPARPARRPAARHDRGASARR
jgi:ABC-2 type transport system permease protein